MRIIETKKMKRLEAEGDKRIRCKNDVYFKDENNEEHFPHYSTLIFLPKTISDEEIEKTYIEE